MSSKYCYSCGEESILEVDGAAGNSVCTRCGTVRLADSLSPQTQRLISACDRSSKKMQSFRRSRSAKRAVARPWSKVAISEQIKVSLACHHLVYEQRAERTTLQNSQSKGTSWISSKGWSRIKGTDAREWQVNPPKAKAKALMSYDIQVVNACRSLLQVSVCPTDCVTQACVTSISPST